MSTLKTYTNESKTVDLISKEDLRPTSNEFLQLFCTDSDYDFLQKFHLMYDDVRALRLKAYDENTSIEHTMLCLLRISELQTFTISIQLPIILFLQEKQNYVNAYTHSLYSMQNTNFTQNELTDPNNQAKVKMLYECHVENLYHVTKYEQVIEIGSQFLSTYPYIISARIFHMSFFANVKLKNWPKALVDITRTISIHPNNATFFNHRCFVYCEMGNFEKALDDANNCIGIEPDHQIGLNNRGSVLNDLARYELAIIDLDKAVKVTEAKNANAFRHRAFSYYKLGKYEDAISDINQALGIDNQYEDAKKLKKQMWNEFLEWISIGIELYCQENSMLFLTPLVHVVTDYVVGSIS